MAVQELPRRSQRYFGNKLQGSGWKLNWKSEPTATGWSEVTVTVAETLGARSGLSVGMTQVTIIVFRDDTGTVALPVCPGYVVADPGMVTPNRLLPFTSRMCTATLAVVELPLKIYRSARGLPAVLG